MIGYLIDSSQSIFLLSSPIKAGTTDALFSNREGHIKSPGEEGKDLRGHCCSFIITTHYREQLFQFWVQY